MKVKFKKLPIHSFHPTIYPRRLYVVRKGTPEQINAFFLDQDGAPLMDVEDSFKSAKVAVWNVRFGEDKKLGVLVWLICDVDVSVVAHEAVHVVNKIFKDCGISYDWNNDEHFAYLVGWAADCIWQTWTGKFKD